MHHIQYLIVVSLALLSVPTSRSLATEPADFTPPDCIAYTGSRWRMIHVPVKIGDETFLFVLDTGCSMTVVDKSLEKFLGPVTKYEIANTGIGEIEVGIHKRPEVEIGDATLSRMKIRPAGLIASADLSMVRDRDDPDIYGFLGMDLMRDWVVMLAFDNGLLAIWREHPPSFEFGGERVALQFGPHGRPQVQAKIRGNLKQLFEIDTGMDFTVSLPREQYVQEINSGRIHQTNTTSLWTLGGEGESGLARPYRIELGRFKHDNLVVHYSHSASIGLPYWRKYRVVFDFPGQAMLLANGKRYPYPDVSDRGGIRLKRSNGKCVLAADVGSLGHQMGIRDGDVLTVIDGVSAGEAGGWIEKRLEMNDIGHVRLTIQRGNSEYNVVIPRPWSEEEKVPEASD